MFSKSDMLKFFLSVVNQNILFPVTIACKLPKWSLMLKIVNNYTSAWLGICAPSDTRIHKWSDTLFKCNREDKKWQRKGSSTAQRHARKSSINNLRMICCLGLLIRFLWWWGSSCSCGGETRPLVFKRLVKGRSINHSNKHNTMTNL